MFKMDYLVNGVLIEMNNTEEQKEQNEKRAEAYGKLLEEKKAEEGKA